MDQPLFQTIFQVLETHNQGIGQEPALDFIQQPPITYSQLFHTVSKLAVHLQHLGVESRPNRSRIAIVFPNGPAMTLALLAVSCVGVAVPFNPSFQAEEFESYFKETDVRFLLIPKNLPHVARQVAKDLNLTILDLDPLEFLDLEMNSSRPAHLPEPSDVALILLTSGSTGRGKKVPLTHKNLCTSAMDVCRSLSLTSDDRCLCMWEQFHIGGLVDLLLAPLASGGRVLSAGGFNSSLFFECLSQYRPTWFQGVPTTLRELCFHAKMHEIPTLGSSLRFIRSVAAALPEAWMLEIETRFGVPVIQTFGMTEASPLITSNRLPPGKRKPGSTGQPCGPLVEIMDDTGNPVSRLSQGAIAVKGDNIFAGYEGDPEANSVSFRQGWFYTGDTGYFDEEGFLFITGRIKELINRGGEKILPYEVDERLLAHPAIEQAAAFSVPHPSLGEDVGAAVVLKAGASLDELEIKSFVAEKLAAFKVPRKIIFLKELPRCPVGKVRRGDLAKLAASLSTKAPYQPPSTPLETFLTELWAIELDVPQVGLDDDYQELGGDSLTSARLILAIETLLKIRLPDSSTEHLSTVRHLGRFLEPYVLSKQSQNSTPGLTSIPLISRDQIQAALKKVSGSLEDLSSELSDTESLFRQWRNSRTAKEFLEHRHRNLTFFTPKEVWDFTHFDPNGNRTRFFRVLRSILSWKLKQEESRWQSLILKEFHGKKESFQWQRRVLNPFVYHFTCPQGSASTKTLIVGFTSLAKRLFMPIYRFLLHLDPNQFDVLLLMDPHRSHFEKGISEWAPTIESIPQKIKAFSTQHGYARMIGFGTSAGALPAILSAIQNQWDKALVIGPDLPSRHPYFTKNLPAKTALDGMKLPEITIAYAGKNARDKVAVAELEQILPQIQLHPDPRFSHHNILEELQQIDELHDFLKTHFSPARRN